MRIKQQRMGEGHIFCLADTLDAILRQLSPEFFAATHRRLIACLDSFGIRVPLRLGWMHPGYACPALDSATLHFDDPVGIFGWVTKSPHVDPQVHKTEVQQIVASLTREPPLLQWATCSARLFRFLRVDADDYDTAHQLFLDFAVSEPCDWAISSIVSDRGKPLEPWKQLCAAAASHDSDLERELWRIARESYTPSALQLLSRGVELTRDCPV